MWNTVTVQYNPLIEEEFDEHFKVTCEYGYDFWKTVTFPFLDVEQAVENFYDRISHLGENYRLLADVSYISFAVVPVSVNGKPGGKERNL